MMRELCNLVSLAVKELNEYNEYDKRKLMEVVNVYKELNEFSQQNNNNDIELRLIERLKTLWSIFEESGKVLLGLFERI